MKFKLNPKHTSIYFHIIYFVSIFVSGLALLIGVSLTTLPETFFFFPACLLGSIFFSFFVEVSNE